jgi:hypothetical protein
MRVESHPEVLLDHSQRAYEAATGDTLTDAVNGAPRRTGEYAGTLRLGPMTQGDRLSTSIGSPLPQAGAVEHGVDVGPGQRGPHMAGAHSTAAAVAHFSDYMTRRLRDTAL